jgi:uncharacterized protein (DUF1499 family)
MKVLTVLAALAAFAIGAFALWVRLAPSDPAIWHVDPSTVTARNARNSFLLRDGAGADAPALRLSLPPAEVATRLDAAASATPRTSRLAGQGAFVTWVTRSALWGFPDYTSVRILPDGSGSTVAVFARARFGEGDLGVNRARVEAWLRPLSP